MCRWTLLIRARRLRYIARDADLKVLVTMAGLANQIDAGTTPVITLDPDNDSSGDCASVPQHSTALPDDPAYIVYTSGSTGNPKGVLIPHRAFLRCRLWAETVFRFTAEDRFLFKSVRAPEELLFPFSVGATVVIAPPDADRDVSKLIDTLLGYDVTVLGLSPALLRLLASESRLSHCRSLKQVFSSGEGLSSDVARKFLRQTGAALYNFYGLAEAPFTALWKCAGNEQSANLPIGCPLDADLQVLGDDLQPQSAGQTGELYVGGPGLALRYVNLPELTAKRFIEYSSGRRLYRTGDLGYRDEQGVFHVTGRNDFQVKIRGFRVELTEVEAALLAHDAIREAVVVLRDNDLGEPGLTAYLVPAEGVVTVESLRGFLVARLPDYAVPTEFRMLSRLPLTPTGKVDRNALRTSTGSEIPAGTCYVAPANERERRLVAIWQDLLGVKPIGINDNFFHLGGHSLTATKVIARVRSEFGRELPLRELFEAPTVAQLSARLTGAARIGTPLYSRQQREGPVDLSFAQERLWFLDQLVPESSAYHIPDVYEVQGHLDVAALEHSLRAVVQRHELLRTTLQLFDGRPVQVIAPSAYPTIGIVDRSGLSPEQQEREIDRQIAENSATVFNLATGPLLQLRVVRLAETRFLILVNMHHVVSDDWSMGVLYRELSLFYNAFKKGEQLELPPLTIQYADYAICQREWLKNGELDRQLAYWQKELDGLPTLELPTDFPRPPRQTFVGTRIPFSLSAELTRELKKFCRGENATHFMTLLAAFQVLLARYSGQRDIAVGTPIANRRHVEVEDLFGFFVNMLVLRGDLKNDANFRDLVSLVRGRALDAYQNQDLPFEKLVEALNPERDLSRPPLFQVMFALQDVPTHPLTLSGGTVQRRVHSVHATHFDLELYLSTTSDAWTGFVGYNTDLFGADTIERLIGHYQALLVSLLRRPDDSVFTATMLAPVEQQQLLQWNGEAAIYGPSDCIHQLFELQAAQAPDRIALQFEEKALTYRELDDRANALAVHLETLGVGREKRVGVCVERSLDMVVALLAILKAGGTYVPIDIHFPPDRITLILNDAAVETLVLHESLRPLCCGFTGTVVSLDHLFESAASSSPGGQVSGNDAAYIYYTSGSAGRPKGVILEHRSVVNFLRAMQREPGISRDDVLLALTTISFDPAVLDIFLPLSVGARVVIVPEATRMDPDRLLELLHQSEATILQATPTTWQLLMRSPWIRKNLRALIGGEILTSELAGEILKRCGELWNLYGPTETTVWSTVGRVERPDDITIGKPIPNQRAYIVDQNNQLVPVGVPGELHIGGAGVGRSYVAQLELTAERFVRDPFSKDPDARLYRTGDRCRYRADGRIEFLGRIDHQIKIRGFRVEPGEIEAALIEHPAIQQCAVIDRTEASGEKRLIAYVVPTDLKKVPAAPDLREFLRHNLPDYMLPAAFVAMEKLPLTRSGKVQRSELPAPESTNDPAGQNIVGRNPIERQVAQIWREALNLNSIGLTDDFFLAGGHSLLAVRVMAEVNSAFGTNLPLATIFRSPTIETLSEAVQNNEGIKQKAPGLISPREEERGQRIFWAPSIGAVERYIESQNLARLLRGQYRFFGFDPAPEFENVAGLAKHCVGLIREEQPRGPYFLAGYCQCGHVVYEIATQLAEQGEEVALLGIIDCSARDFASGLRQRFYWIRDGFRGRPRVVAKRIRSVVRRKLFGANGAAKINPPGTNQFVFHNLAVSRHKVGRFPGAIELFRSEEWLSRLPHSPKLGWDALARSVQVHQLECKHLEMLSVPTAVEFIARRFSDYSQRHATTLGEVD